MYFREFVPKLFTLARTGISRTQLLRDISAGLLVGVMAVPLSLAFSIASGAAPEQGMITAIIAGFIVSFFGGSRVQVAGPTGAFVVIIYSVIREFGMEGLLLATLLAGVILILMGLLKFGSLLKYVPQTLIIGFTTGIAILIFMSQIEDFLGLELSGTPENLIQRLGAYRETLHTLNLWAAVVGFLTLFIIIVMPRALRKYSRLGNAAGSIPWAFIAIIISGIITSLFHLPVETIATRFGEIKGGGFHFQEITISWELVQRMLPSAFSIALLGALESLLSAVVADSMIGGNHRSNMELIAQGAANILSPLFGGLPATGALARTAANIKNGGRTPIAGIVHALFLLFLYLFAMSVIGFVPMAALAGVTIMVAWNMSEIRVFVQSLRINFYEALVLSVTFLLTLFTDLTIAIPVGFMLSLVLFMKRMADSTEAVPLMSVKIDEDRLFSSEVGEYPDTIAIYELNGPMFFGSVHTLMRIQKRLGTRYRVLILRFRYVPIMDTAALHRLNGLVKGLKSSGCRVLISGAHENIVKKLLNHTIITETQIFATIGETVEAARVLLE